MDSQMAGTWGNAEYLQWLRVCNALCRRSRSEPERWIYSALCGNVSVLMSWVEGQNNDGNWFDYLWVLCVCRRIYAQHQLLCSQLPSYFHGELKHEALENCAVFKALAVVDEKWEAVLRDFESIFQWIELNKNSFIPKRIDGGAAGDDGGDGGDGDGDGGDGEDGDGGLFVNLKGYFSGKGGGSSSAAARPLYSFSEDCLESEYNEQYYEICKFVICEDAEALLASCCRFTANERLRRSFKDGITLDFMRFVIHLVLHLNPQIASRRSDKSPIPEALRLFIQQFVAKLIANGHYDMIARYCFILPKSELVATMTSFLVQLEDTQWRIALITKAKEVLPPRVISQISANIAKFVIAEGIEASNAGRNEWRAVAAPQPLTAEDLHKIDSLRCLQMVHGNAHEILLRANQLFAMFAREWKVEAMQKLFADTAEIVRFQQRPAASLQGVGCHLNAFRCFKEYVLVMDALDSWRMRYDAMPQRDRATSIGLLLQYLRAMLRHRGGWMNPRDCAIEDLDRAALDELRAVVLRRVLETAYAFAAEANQHAFCMELVAIFADERLAYYKLFESEKAVIRRLLAMAKDAKIEMIRLRQGLEPRNGAVR